MLCPNCESENRENAKFCDQCGFPLTGAIARFAQSSLDGEAAGNEDYENDAEKALEAVDEAGEPAGEQAEATTREAPDALVDGDDESAAEFEPDAQEDAESGLEPVIEELEAHELDDDGVSDGESDKAPEEAMPEAASSVLNAGEVAVPAYERSDNPSEDLFSHDDTTQVIGGLAGQDDVTEVLDDFPIVFDEAPPADVTQRLDDLWAPDVTMQMPRIEGDDPSQSRDFMASSAKEQQRPSRKGIVIAIVVVAVLALAALAATYFAGVWGGKEIPDVTGMTETDARAVLEKDGFTVKALQVKSDDTEGLVLLMDPSGDTRAAEGSEVVIHVATARLIPDVNGYALEDAQAALSDAGYDYVDVVQQKDNGDEGMVLAMEPEAGSRAKSTTTVTLTVSEAYRVPDVSGMGTWDAYAAIEAEGLTPTIIYVDTLEYIDGTLMGVYPESGTKMQAGDYVSLNVARARAYQLEALTQSYLAPGNTITYGGYEFVIEALNSVSYAGNDTVAFSATARPKITLFGETLFTSSAQTIQGTVVWSADNQVVSVQ